MFSVESCRISFPNLSDTPNAEEEAEIARAVAAIEMMSVLSEAPKRLSVQQEIPAGADEAEGVVLTEDEERAQLLLAFSDSGLVQDICLSPVIGLPGDVSPIEVSPVEASPVREETLPQVVDDIFNNGPSSHEESEESDISAGSAFEEVQLVYMNRGVQPQVAAARLLGHYGVSSVHQARARILQVTNPDPCSSSSSSSSHVPIRRVPQGPLRRRPRQPLRVVNAGPILSTSSGFAPLPRHFTPPPQQEYVAPIRAPIAGTPIRGVVVKRKPVPKLSITTNDPSFALSSSSESFVIHRARRVQNVADPLAGLANQRKDAVRNLQLRRILGRGAQGQVYLAHGPDPSKLLAVKVNPKHATECVRMLLQEQRLLHRLRECPFVLDLQASFHDTENFYIVTGFHSGGDLRQLLKKRKVLDLAAAKFYLAEAVCAINYIHRNGVVHRDIKPANILIKGDGHLCLADFGLCKDWMSQDLYGEDVECLDHVHARDLSTDEETQMTDAFVGTIPYMSPEAISREPYSYETDWWSLGITFYEMVTGDIPWCANTFEDTVLLIREAPLPYETEADVDVDATTKDFLEKLLRKEPSKRFKFPGIVSHRLFDDIDFDDVEDYQLTPPWVPSTNVSQLASSRLQYLEKVFVGEPYAEGSDPFPAYEYAGDVLRELDQPQSPTENCTMDNAAEPVVSPPVISVSAHPRTSTAVDDTSKQLDSVLGPSQVPLPLSSALCSNASKQSDRMPELSDLALSVSATKEEKSTWPVVPKTQEYSVHESLQFSDALFATPKEKAVMLSLSKLQLKEAPQPKKPTLVQGPLPLRATVHTPALAQRDTSIYQDLSSYLRVSHSPQAASIISAISEESDPLFSVNLFDESMSDVTSFATVPCLDYHYPRPDASKDVPEKPKRQIFRWIKKAGGAIDKFMNKVAHHFKV